MRSNWKNKHDCLIVCIVHHSRELIILGMKGLCSRKEYRNPIVEFEN